MSSQTDPYHFYANFPYQKLRIFFKFPKTVHSPFAYSFSIISLWLNLESPKIYTQWNESNCTLLTRTKRKEKTKQRSQRYHLNHNPYNITHLSYFTFGSNKQKMLGKKISKGAQHEYDTEQNEATRGGKLNQSDARLGWKKGNGPGLEKTQSPIHLASPANQTCTKVICKSWWHMHINCSVTEIWIRPE